LARIARWREAASRVQNSRFKIQDWPLRGVQNSRFKITTFGGFKIPGSKFKIKSEKFLAGGFDL
jgi:hypothetical protein